MAYLPHRASLTALVGLLTACNAISGVDDFVFDGSGSTTTGGGAAPTGGGGAPAGSGGAGGAPVVDGCGDGLVDLMAGEQCDDGNLQSGDGCAADCTYELSDGCPTVELHLAGEILLGFTGDTSRAADDLGASCGGANAPDVVLLIRAAAKGTLAAELVADHAGILWMASACPLNGSAELVCNDAPPLSADVPVLPDELIYVGVDGRAGEAGPFQLTLGIY